MGDAYTALEGACGRLEDRHPAWLDQLGLGKEVTVGEVVQAVRGPDVHRSDELLRGLLGLHVAGDEVVTVVLAALAPLLRRRLQRAVTRHYREEALSDLAVAVLEARARGELAAMRAVAQRLVNRAHTRVHKRCGNGTGHPDRRVFEVVPLPPELLPVAAGPDLAADVGDRVAARLDAARRVDAVTASTVEAAQAWACWRRAEVTRGLAGRSRDRRQERRALLELIDAFAMAADGPRSGLETMGTGHDVHPAVGS